MSEVFVSYETREGLALAYGVFAALADLDVRAWVWQLHHQSGRDTFEEMAEELKAADSVFVICTEHTRDSDGQRDEIGQAKSQKKQIFVLTPDPSHIPDSLGNVNYDRLTLETVVPICSNLVRQWRLKTDVGITTTTTNEGEPLPIIATVVDK